MKQFVYRSLASPLLALAASLVLAALPAPAGAQTALTVGSVRDARGSAIAGATVEGYAAGGARIGFARTDTAGTFALEGGGIVRVVVRCRFCQDKSLDVVSGTPVVAIVRRFEALLSDAPSPSDLTNLPYSRVDSSIALRPFTLLRQTTNVAVGSQLGSYGFQPAGSLLFDSGVPSYDVVDGLSPYDAIPANDVRVASVAPPSAAFLYGDRAGSGTVSVDPFGDGNENVALVGGNTSFRLQAGSPQANAVLTASNDQIDWRQRFDGQFQTQLAASQTLGLNASTSQYRQTDSSGNSVYGSYSLARGTFSSSAPNYDFAANLFADRGAYDADGVQEAYNSIWSDSGFNAGVRTRGTVFAFADAGVRLSSGSYDAQGSLYDATGNVVQRRIDAGFEADEPYYRIVAGVGDFGINYNGNGWGGSGGQHASLATPSFQLTAFPDDRWSGSFAASGSFVLPTLVEQYDAAEYHTLALDRAASYVGTLSYTDFRRVRFDVEAGTQRLAGADVGLITTAGMSATWQFAPALSLRAWVMRFDDATSQPIPTPYAPTTGSGTVNALWLTYENPGAIRFDAIYRRDLLNGQPFQHIDGDVSGPVVKALRWYAGIEDVVRATYLSLGLRFTP